jgi:GNAT superfamily N-acetyltransferase
VTIRPPGPADLAALSGFFAGLSMRSRVQRFFAPVRPTSAVVRLACGLAGPAGDSPAAGTDALVATLGDVIIGHAMAVDRPVQSAVRPAQSAVRPAQSAVRPAQSAVRAARPAVRPAPPGGLVTEFGVVVADAWQAQGVGSALVRALISRAQARGVTSLSLDVLPANRPVLAMIAAHWTAVRTQRHADCVTIQTALAPDPALAPGPAGPAGPAGLVPGPREHQRELASRGWAPSP